jgi:DNA-binding NarL/FixJ family response regulator
VPERRSGEAGELDAPRTDPAEPESAEEAPWTPLTERQREVLVHVARGMTNREIGSAMGISERTVRNHMRAILRRLSSPDRTHAVVVAIGHGWIAIPIEARETPDTLAQTPTSEHV